MLNPILDMLVQSMNLVGSYITWVPAASCAVCNLEKVFKSSVTASLDI